MATTINHIPVIIKHQIQLLRNDPNFSSFRGSDQQFIAKFGYKPLLQPRYFPIMTIFNLDKTEDKIVISRQVSRNIYRAKMFLNSMFHSEVLVDFKNDPRVFRALRNNKVPVIWFSSSWFFWNKPVLVKSCSEKISDQDDAREIGRQTLAQLTSLAMIGQCLGDLRFGHIQKTIKRGEIKYWITSYRSIVRFQSEVAYCTLWGLHTILSSLNTHSKRTAEILASFKDYLLQRNSDEISPNNYLELQQIFSPRPSQT